jgi:hypothetical protein
MDAKPWKIKDLELLGDYNRKLTKWGIAIPQLNKDCQSPNLLVTSNVNWIPPNQPYFKLNSNAFGLLVAF